MKRLNKFIVLSPKRLIKRLRLIMIFSWATLRMFYKRSGHIERFFIVSVILGNICISVTGVYKLLIMPYKLYTLFMIIATNFTLCTILYAIYLDEYLRFIREYNQAKDRNKSTEE